MVGDGFGGRLWYQPYGYGLGSHSAFAICGDAQQLYSWGSNIDEQLGNSDQTGTPSCGRRQPMKVNGMSNVIYHSSSNGTSCAIKKDRSLWVWGGSYGDVPQQIDTDVKHAYTTQHRCIWVKLDGTTRYVGGYTSTNPRGFGKNPTVSQINYMKNGVRVACTFESDFVLTSDGDVYSRGFNARSTLGFVTTRNFSPNWTKLDLKNIVDIQANAFGCYALDKDGNVYAWGIWYTADSTPNHSIYTTPVRVPDLWNIVCLSATYTGYLYTIDNVGNCRLKKGLNVPPITVAQKAVDVLTGYSINSFVILEDQRILGSGKTVVKPPPCAPYGSSIWLDVPPGEVRRDSFTELNPSDPSIGLCKPSPVLLPNDFSYLSGGCIHDLVEFRAGNTTHFSNFSWDFGDGTDLVYGPFVTHQYRDTGVYEVEMHSKSANTGQWDTVRKTVYVRKAHFVPQLAEEAVLCSGGNVRLEPLNHRVFNSYEWWDGRDSFNRTVTSPGTYVLNVRDYTGCFYSDTIHVIAKNKPQVTVLSNDRIFCNRGDSMLFWFKNTHTNDSITSIRWKFNSYTYAQDSVHLENLNVGKHQIELVLATKFECLDSATYDFEVLPIPKAAIWIEDDTQCSIGNLFRFRDTSQTMQGYSFDYIWDLGDGTKTVLNHPTPHSYKVFGKFGVTLNVSNQRCSDSAKAHVMVHPNPIARIDAVDSACLGEAIAFSHSSELSQGTIAHHTWDFGDDHFSDQTAPLHTYQNPGVYYVSLYVASDQQCTDTHAFDQPVVVYPRPTAGYTHAPEYVNIDDPTVAFSNTSTGAEHFQWFFDDGNQSVARNPEHTYLDTGIFDVWLYAKNTFGCKDSVQHRVRIHPPFSLFMPSAFSPNGDGLNDVIKPVTGELQEVHFHVYDRWGAKVFETNTEHHGWDGTNHNGEPVPIGVYLYVINASSKKDNWFQYAGTIVLTR